MKPMCNKCLLYLYYIDIFTEEIKYPAHFSDNFHSSSYLGDCMEFYVAVGNMLQSHLI